MHQPDLLRVAQRAPSILRWQVGSKLLQHLKLRSQLNLLTLLIQQHTQQRLCTTSVLNRLLRKPHIRCIFLYLAISWTRVFLGWVFEEEDDAVDWCVGADEVLVEGDELFALDAGGAEIVEEEGEDASIGLNCGSDISIDS